MIALQDEELQLLRSEINGRPLRISFDETTIQLVVLCVIVAFVDSKGQMQERVLKLALYNEAPEEKLTNQMSDHIIHAIEEVLAVPRYLIKVFTRDGVYLNELCMMKLCGGKVIDPNTNREIRMRGIYPDAINIKCMSHTLDNCGADYTVRGTKFNRIEGQNAKKIYNQINGLFSSPGKSANIDWSSYAGSTMPSVSQTRWWSREEFWEYLVQYLKYDGGDETAWFDEWVKLRGSKLRSDKKSIGVHLAKLEEYFVPGSVGYDEKFLVTAFIEIAVAVDVTKKVREATYLIEGNGPIAVMIVEILDAVNRYYSSTYKSMDYPNVRRHIANAVALKILPPGYKAPAVVRVEGLPTPAEADCSETDAVPALPTDADERQIDRPDITAHLGAADLEVAWDYEDAWIAYCLQISAPYMKYFSDMVMAHNCMPIWRAASVADPLNMQRKTITPRDLRLAVEPLVSKLITSALLDTMIAELSEYERACSTLDWGDDTYAKRLVHVLDFWASHKLLPAWTEFAHTVFLLQPTSACVERAFSILKYVMGDQQMRSLRDKIEGSLMLRFNRGIKR